MPLPKYKQFNKNFANKKDTQQDTIQKNICDVIQNRLHVM